MKTETTIQILKTTIGNPATRKLLKGMSKYCEKDGKNRIEVAIELYTGQRKDACLSCKATEKVIAKVLKKGAGAFGLTEEQLKEKFRDPHWSKGLSSTIRGIAEFGIRRPFTSGAPFQIVWDVTYACNLHCKHCYARAGKPWKDELTTEEAKRAIDIFERAGVTIISFSGGEPLVRPDIMELVRYAADKGIYVAFATNGTLITKEKAREMKEAGAEFLQISLDGIDAKTHDEFRGMKGAFDRTVQGIKNAVAEGFFVEVATTITRYNYKQIPDIVQFAEDLGADWFMAYNFVPTGRGKEIFNMDLSPQEREEALKMLWNELKTRKKINVLSTAPEFARVALQQESVEEEKIVPTHFYNPKLAGQLVDLAEFIGGCGAGRFYMSMRANGDLQPCVFLPVKVGNIREDDFEEMWKHNKILEELRNKDILHGCETCEFRYTCGGCRARAYAYTGDYLAPDPGCIYNTDVYEKAVKEWK